MAALRAGTEDLHEEADLRIREGDWLSSSAAYAAFLGRHLAFSRIVEAALAPYLSELGHDGWQWRPRSPLLEADLGRIGWPGTGPSQVDAGSGGFGQQAPLAVTDLGVTEASEAIGVLYVVEGSTLGGRVLAHWIHARLGYDGESGASSFVPHGAATTQRWRAFGELAERVVRLHPARVGAMVACARRTFELHASLVSPAPADPFAAVAGS